MPKPALCPCGEEPCRPGQRYGRRCHAQAQRRYRRSVADQLRRLRKIEALAARDQQASVICETRN